MKKFVLLFALFLGGLGTSNFTFAQCTGGLSVFIVPFPEGEQKTDTTLWYQETTLFVTTNNNSTNEILFLFAAEPGSENFQCSYICAFSRDQLSQIYFLVKKLGPMGLKQKYQKLFFSDNKSWQNWPSQ